MFEDKKDINQSEQLVKRYENNRQHYFKLEEFIAITDYYAATNNYKNALEVNDTAEIFYPSSFELKTIKADLHIRNNDIEEAEKILENIEFSSDVIADVYVLQGEIYTKKHQHEMAEKAFDKAIESCEDKDVIVDLICDFLMSDHQYKLAKKYLEKAQKLCNNPDLMYWLAKCYEQEYEYRKAASVYETMVKMFPLDENLWDELGDSYMLMAEYENAIKAFDFRLAVDNTNAKETLINKAECFSLLGKNDDARKIYNKILATEKGCLDAKFGIAKSYEREEMYDVAEKLYLDIVEEDANYLDAYCGLGVIYSRKNELETAEKFMRKTLTGNEIVPVFLVELSKILLSQEKVNEAQITMEKFINLDICKHDYRVWLLYAEIIARNDIEKAIEILDKKFDENFYHIAELCYHLAYYHFLNDDISQCVVNIERGLELNENLISPFFDLCPEAMLNEQIMNVYLSFKMKKQ